MSPTVLTYLAHPIDFTDSIRNRVAGIASTMNSGGLAAYIPSYAFKLPHDALPTEGLSRINRAALTECDALIAFLPPPGQTSVGVYMEIETAREQGKPTLIVGDAALWTRSWALPRTELVLYTDEFDRGSAQALRSMVARQWRLRSRPAPTRAMYVQLDPGASLPTRAYDGDAGFDMYTLEDTVIPAGQFVDVPVGLRIQFPEGVWGMIAGRSSTVRKLDLLVTPGVIDSGYRGPLFAGVRSLRSDDYTVRKGERLAQIIPFQTTADQLHATPVDVLAPSQRGESGFGSSGS